MAEGYNSECLNRRPGKCFVGQTGPPSGDEVVIHMRASPPVAGDLFGKPLG